MATESPIEYGPHFPDREQTQTVLNDPDQEIEGIETTVRLYVDEKQRRSEEMKSPKVERILLNVDVGIMHIEAGFLSLARDCYYDTFDILEFDQSLTEDEGIRLATELKVLERKISDFLDTSEMK